MMCLIILGLLDCECWRGSCLTFLCSVTDGTHEPLAGMGLSTVTLTQEAFPGEEVSPRRLLT